MVLAMARYSLAFSKSFDERSDGRFLNEYMQSMQKSQEASGRVDKYA
jgi:hypothetical protein